MTRSLDDQMHVVDRGSGPPLVLVPGLQGRWEWVAGVVDALAASFRVITFHLADEPGARVPFDRARGFDAYADHVLSVMDAAHVPSAILCGISFGGLIALRVAAMRPERVSKLILASTPGPGWHLKPRHAMYAQFPRVFSPFFFAEATRRLHRELAAAFPDPRTRWRFSYSHLPALFLARVSSVRMARRALMIADVDAGRLASQVTMPTLVMTGEPELDHVVAVDRSSEYARLIQDARLVTLERTGHLGSITRPAEFAAAVRQFANGPSHAAA